MPLTDLSKLVRLALLGAALPFAGASGLDAAAPSPSPKEDAAVPAPEPVQVSWLPFPPTAPSEQEGACSLKVNSHATGCISLGDRGMQEGPGYMWDNRHVLMTVVFGGAPAAPAPSSKYSGAQVIAIRTDGTLFPNVTAPACGGVNPLPCPMSTEPGGRRTRLMMATLAIRKPPATQRVAPEPIKVGWAMLLRPGDPLPRRKSGLPAGTYVLEGRQGGRANVEISQSGGSISSISVRYVNFTDDGQHIINGTESASRVGKGLGARAIWHSDLRSTGRQNGTKRTGPGGLVFTFRGPVEGDLVTTIDGHVYRRPQPGT